MAHGERVAVELRPRYTTIVGVGTFVTGVLDVKEYRTVPWNDIPMNDIPKKPTE